MRTAEALRRHGHDGPLTIVGAEDEAPYDRPPLSKDYLADRIEADETRLQLADGLDARWLLGTGAVGLETQTQRVVLSDGQTLSYDGLVIATGARPRWLRCGVGVDGVCALRTLSDARGLRDALAGSPTVVVIGAGLIGSEVASTCRMRGLDVTIVDPLAAPMEHVLGPTVADIWRSLHEHHGARFRLGRSVTAIEGAGRVERIELDSGERVGADVVVMAVGVEPDTAWLDGSGLDVRDGVPCDAWLRVRTSAGTLDNVVAVGDVAHVESSSGPGRGHWTTAVEQSAVAASTLVRGTTETSPFASVPFFWSDQYGIKIQFAGQAGPSSRTRIVDGEPGEHRFFAVYENEAGVVGGVGFGRAARVMRTRKELAEALSR